MSPISFLFKSSSLVTRTVAQLAVVGTVGALSFGVMSSSAFTSLTAVAQNAATSAATSGDLKLTQVVNGVGFSTAIAGNMAPGDTVNRFLNYTNAGTLPATGLYVSMADASPTALTSLANKTVGLQVTVTSCVAPFTAATGACVGGAAAGVGPITTTVADLIATPTTSGLLIASPTVIAAGAVYYLKFSISLAGQNEWKINGAAATQANGSALTLASEQNLTAALTVSLNEVQAAAAIVTNS